MKKFLILFVLCSAIANAQYSVKGTMTPVEKHTWALLYKIEGARQVFLKNSQITKDGITGTFSFEMDADAEVGSYRVTYDLQGNGYIDFLYNKEDVEFTFDPKDPYGSVNYTKSLENGTYQSFLKDISLAQYKVDSLQIDYLQNPKETTVTAYTKAIENINLVQKSYNEKTEGTLVQNFIKATDRFNSPSIAKSGQEYLKGVIGHFYDNIDFTNKSLYASSFLVDRIADYVFSMNYADTSEEQLKQYKNSSDISLSKIGDVAFKSDVIQFLVTQFSGLKNIDMINYLMTNYYNKLPAEHKNAEFETQIKESTATMVGNVAPDFDWEEKGVMQSLSSLEDGEHYILIFYSTGCSHCLREVPKVYQALKGKSKTKVVAFAMEEDDITWKEYMKQFPEWHHVLGLGKWQNKTARTYQINATPTYFLLNKDKKIIATPDKLEDLKAEINQLN